MFVSMDLALKEPEMEDNQGAFSFYSLLYQLYTNYKNHESMNPDLLVYHYKKQVKGSRSPSWLSFHRNTK